MAEFIIQSEVNKTESQLKPLFEYITDFKNFASFMPEDKVENFEFTSDGCSFNIKGITPLKVKIKDKQPYAKVIFESEGLAKFNFLLEVNLIGDSNTLGQCSVYLKGDINPFLKVMAEKPLTTLVNTMSARLSTLKL